MELRKDYLTNDWVIIASNRGARPDQFKREPESKEVPICFFCPGNESTTPTEIGRRGEPWFLRWFPNKFPAVAPEGDPEHYIANTFYSYSQAVGAHEVIVESPNHNDNLSDLAPEHIKELLDVYSERIETLSRVPGIRYVQVFKNHGRAAGTSLVHTHSQIIAYNKIPKNVEAKVAASTNFPEDPYTKIIESEKNSERGIQQTLHAVSFCPYASKVPFQAMILPKRSVPRLSDLEYDELMDLAHMLKHLLVRLKTLNAPYNLAFYYAPTGANFRMHFELLPRLTRWGGFELATGDIINTVAPKDAATFYR